MEPALSAYREIVIPVDFGKGEEEIRVPFTVELLKRVEDTLLMAQDVNFAWFRIRKSDKTVLAIYEAFCKPYIPAIDFSKLQPTFCSLFFSAVRRELLRSIDESQKSLVSTGM